MMPDGSDFSEVAAADLRHRLATGQSAEILAEDGTTWIATKGDRMVDRREGPGVVMGWEDPVRWDDEAGRHVRTTPDDPDAIYKAVRLRLDRSGFPLRCSDLTPAPANDRSSPAAMLGKPPLHILSYDEMVAMPEAEWLVDGLLVEGTSALLFGKSNSFKSFLAIDIACAIATGRSWHGAQVRKPGPVLYVATEGARGVAKQRIPGWMEAHEIPAAQRGNLYLYPEEIALDDKGAVSALLKSCAIVRDQRGPAGAFRLVVVDIFGASMLGPETSDETARAWVRNVNRINREMGSASLTVAHTGWADESRARMHTHFWGSFDTRLKAEGDKEKRTTVLTVDRHKDADSTGTWGFRLETATLSDGKTTLFPLLSDDIETGPRRRVSGKPAVALQALSEALIDHGRVLTGPNYPTCPVVSVEQWRAMSDRHGLTDSENPETTRKAFNRARTDLIEKGLVRQFENHVWKVQADG